MKNATTSRAVPISDQRWSLLELLFVHRQGFAPMGKGFFRQLHHADEAICAKVLGRLDGLALQVSVLDHEDDRLPRIFVSRPFLQYYRDLRACSKRP